MFFSPTPVAVPHRRRGHDAKSICQPRTSSHRLRGVILSSRRSPLVSHVTRVSLKASPMPYPGVRSASEQLIPRCLEQLHLFVWCMHACTYFKQICQTLHAHIAGNNNLESDHGAGRARASEYVYIYIYIERERERERDSVSLCNARRSAGRLGKLGESSAEAVASNRHIVGPRRSLRPPCIGS